MRGLTGKVLVLGSDTRSFLAVVRSLGRAGLEVHAASQDRGSPAFRSKYLKAVHPLPGHADAAWIGSLMALLESERFAMVVPCSDSDAVALDLHRAELAEWNIAIPPAEAFAIAFDKEKTYALAQSLGVSVPRQSAAKSAAEVEALAGEFGLPLVLKPAASVTAANPGARSAVRKVWRAADLPAAAGAMLERGPLSVQQNFIGIGVGVEVLCREGEILFAFQHERVHEPLAGGGGTYRRSVPLSADLLDAARRLMLAMRYTGVAMIEFKRNTKTGAWVLIEINGRFWGSLPLAIAAGADFPRWVYEMSVFGRRKFPQRYRTGIYARNWRLDARWMVSNFLADRGDPTLMTRPLWKVALEPLHFPWERSDTLTWDDPAPGLVELAEFLYRDVRPLAWALAPVRALMRRRTRAAALHARRIVFLCKGNICRSPFAELYLKDRVGARCEVASAGFLPPAARPSPPAAISAAAALGVDLAEHRSRIVTPEDLGTADVVFVFDPEQEAFVRREYPWAAKKVHYLGVLGPERLAVIEDPWGRDPAEFLRIYRRIQCAIEELLPAPGRRVAGERRTAQFAPKVVALSRRNNG